jgi:HKD family nuclease
LATTIRYVDSATRAHGETLLAWLLKELPSAQQFLVASGYFDATVLDWVEPEIAALLSRGGEAHFTIGSNQGQTQREDLERLLALVASSPSKASLFVVHIPDALFHHKTYFVSGPGRISALVGSPNFTAASGTRNFEAAVIIDADSPVPPLDAIEASLRPAAVASWVNAYQVNGLRDLDALARMGAINVQRPPLQRGPGTPATVAARARRRRTRFPPSAGIAGTPHPTARPRPIVKARAKRASVAPPTGKTFVIFIFARNDLKLTGTGEFSVPAGVKDWAGRVLGTPVTLGQGEFMRINLLARLAASPNAVIAAPEPVRLWSPGRSGGTHQDVRLVLGNAIRSTLVEESTLLYGTRPEGGDVGVLELPDDPRVEPLRLTIYRPLDRDHARLERMTSRTGRQRKRQAVLSALSLVPAWPY